MMQMKSGLGRGEVNQILEMIQHHSDGPLEGGMLKEDKKECTT